MNDFGRKNDIDHHSNHNHDSQQQPRRRRGRLLLINAESLANELAGETAQPIESVPSLFHALGAIAASTAREPVDSVLLSDDQLISSADVVADCIRRVDPAVNLYFANQHHNEKLQATAHAAGFDQIFDTMIDRELIHAIVNGDRIEQSHDMPSLSTGTSLQREFERSVIVESEDDFELPPHEVNDAASMPSTAATLAPATQLGDTDLVATILKNPSNLASVAVDLLRQETGFSDLQFVTNEQEDTFASKATRIVVKHDDATLGHLVSKDVAANTLESWAGWLGQWLALANRVEQLQELAAVDPLTGAWNRRHFDDFLKKTLDQAKHDRRQLNILVFDVDDLKKYNDRHGHEAGDVVLKETVRLMQAVVRKGDKVFRIGGDEFVVVFSDTEPPRKSGSTPLESIEDIIRRFQSEISKMRFPKLGVDAPGELSISAGLATFPWDGTDPETLLNAADQLAIESKRRGKNALTIGRGAKLQSPGNFDV